MNIYDNFVYTIKNSLRGCENEITTNHLSLRFFNRMSDIDIMLELIEFQNYLFNEEVKGTFFKDRDYIMSILLYDNSIQIFNKQGNSLMVLPSHRFSEAKQDFYEKFPNLIQKSNIKDQIDCINQRILKLEQYQANILDKLSVFAELIDSKKDNN